MMKSGGADMKRDNGKKIVLITGASGGIGSAIARKFATDEYAVVLHYHHNKTKAEYLKQELIAAGVEVLICGADLRDGNMVSHMIEEIQNTWGNVDVLINNAGIAQQKLFTDLTDEDWRNMMGIHLDGNFYCSRAVIPKMIEQKEGCIINVSSMWGQVGGSCEVHYSAAKGAIQAMTKALAKELGPSGIRVNCVSPGMIATEMNGNFDEETINALREETPLGKIGTPEEVANTIFFLASREASFIAGQILGVNGGLVV